MLQMCQELGFSIVPQPTDPAIMLVRKILTDDRSDLTWINAEIGKPVIVNREGRISMARVTH